MGKCVTSDVSIGIKIKLSKLLSQINETNFNLMKQILTDGSIEGEDNDLDNQYEHVIDLVNSESINLPNPFDSNDSKNYLKYKKYLKKEIKKKNIQLLDEYLLIPIKKLLSTDKWGYNTLGDNVVSTKLDFGVETEIEKYSNIKGYEIVLMLNQSSW